MPATFLLTASCCHQILEHFLTCRFQVTISISTWLFFDTVHLMKNLKNICLIEKNFSSGLFINSEALPNPISVDGEVSWSLVHQVLEKKKKCEENKYKKISISKQLQIFIPASASKMLLKL